VTRGPVDVRPVADDQWPILGWLWQAFRSDLSVVVDGYPYPDGRFQARTLQAYPGPGRIGYLAWSAHPNTGDDAPVGFALVSGLDGEIRTIDGFWVVPAARRHGLGRGLALDVIGRHRGAWAIPFQHDNHAAGRLWRSVATAAFGADWTETAEPVPGKPHVPPDHWIRTTSEPG